MKNSGTLFLRFISVLVSNPDYWLSVLLSYGGGARYGSCIQGKSWGEAIGWGVYTTNQRGERGAARRTDLRALNAHLRPSIHFLSGINPHLYIHFCRMGESGQTRWRTGFDRATLGGEGRRADSVPPRWKKPSKKARKKKHTKEEGLGEPV